jgi:predicted MPP superfamily phosphohydrolase
VTQSVVVSAAVSVVLNAALSVAPSVVLSLAFSMWLLGHLALCVAVWNRLHALPLRRLALKLFELPLGIWLLAAPWLFMIRSTTPFGSPYPIGCSLFLAWVVIERLLQRLRGRPSVLRTQSTQLVDVARELTGAGAAPPTLAGDWVGRLCGALPGNEIFSLEVARKTLAVRGLPPALDGLLIAHLSDLHLTGHVARAYFEYQVEVANAAHPDIVVITGDILDSWRCREWLGDTLGRLRARYGVFFVLGNHDLRPGPPEELRRSLHELGLVDVGNRTQRVAIRGVDVAITGNERPWFRTAAAETALGTATAVGVAAKPAGTATAAGVAATAERVEPPPAFRLLLSHSPDQIDWAVRHGFPLVLAGHTHGGQIVLPVIGPIVSPSLYGTKYAGGTFEVDGVVLHVSRGLSGEEPLRWNCPPELALLTLTPA